MQKTESVFNLNIPFSRQHILQSEIDFCWNSAKYLPVVVSWSQAHKCGGGTVTVDHSGPNSDTSVTLLGNVFGVLNLKSPSYLSLTSLLVEANCFSRRMCGAWLENPPRIPSPRQNYCRCGSPWPDWTHCMSSVLSTTIMEFVLFEVLFYLSIHWQFT